MHSIEKTKQTNKQQQQQKTQSFQKRVTQKGKIEPESYSQKQNKTHYFMRKSIYRWACLRTEHSLPTGGSVQIKDGQVPVRGNSGG